MPPKKSNGKKATSPAMKNNRFGALNNSDSSDDENAKRSKEEEDFRQLMLKQKQQKEAMRKAEHEAAMLKQKQEKEEKEKASKAPQPATSTIDATPVKATAAAAKQPKTTAAKTTASSSPRILEDIDADEKPASPRHEKAAAAAATAASVAAVRHNTQDDDEGADLGETPVASPQVKTNNNNGNNNDDDDEAVTATTPAEEEELLEVLDKFHVAHGGTSLQQQKEEAELPQQQQEQEQEQSNFSDHGVLLSEQKKLGDREPQFFDYFLLLDFECSCDEAPGFDHEVIEVPALLYDTKTLTVVDEFHTYCRPLRNPILTPFCKQLTGISQEQVDAAPCYDEVIQQLVTWLTNAIRKHRDDKRFVITGKTVCVMTDGPCDLELFAFMFMHRRDGFVFPQIFHRYLDVKQVFRDEWADGKYLKIREMLAKFGLSFAGHQHSGIDDTRNLARIVTKMLQGGTVFSHVYHVTSQSGRTRVPTHLWNKAQQAVRRIEQRKEAGIGPALAEKIRRGASVGEHISGALTSSWLFTRVRVRAGESVAAPTTALLVVMLAIFIATFLMR